MKIKRTIEMDLIELLTWAKDNGKTGEFIGVDDNYRVFISYHHGWVQTDNGKKIPKFETKFKVRQEVEITEDTPINLVYRIKTEKDWQTFDKNEAPINRIINTYKRHPHAYLGFIYLQNPDGSIGELIWSKERGLIE